MSSFSIINYNLRPSKNIQRQLVFEGVRILQERLNINNMVYIGLGSIWFSDFIMAHKLLHIDDMVSIECDTIGHKRAEFNRPYSTVRVLEGFAHEVLPNLFRDASINSRPWLVWLDYDKYLSETLRDDFRSVIERAPENTVLLITFNGTDGAYGRAKHRPDRLRSLLGDVVPDDLTRDECTHPRMQHTLVELTTQFMQAEAANAARPGGFIPAFSIIYKDTSLMITVGGILPAPTTVHSSIKLVADPAWKCQVVAPIVAPHLTLREILALQSQLPREGGLSGDVVRKLGFDLECEKIDAFADYYREYPIFAQVLS